MSKFRDLMQELVLSKSWGRNEVLKLEVDDTMQHQLSSNMDKPVMNRGETMLVLLKLKASSKLELEIVRLCSEFLTFDSNLSKDLVLTHLVNLDGRFFNLIESKLRASNSKRHLVDKLMVCYADYIDE